MARLGIRQGMRLAYSHTVTKTIQKFGAIWARARRLLRIDKVARAVIRGEYGNGAERVRRLIAAGYDADHVQKRVNQIMRGG